MGIDRCGMYNAFMTKIPISARPFFQEYDFLGLNAETHSELVIERLLAYGNRLEVHWLFELYGKDRVRSWVVKQGSLRLPKRRYHLWCVLLDIPEQNHVGTKVWPY